MKSVGAGAGSLSALLSTKDVKVELFLQEIMSQLMCEDLPPNATVDEIEKAYSDKIGEKISGISAVLWHRVGPVVEKLLNQKLKSALENQIVTVVSIVEPMNDMVHRYRALFLEFILSPKLSFAGGHKNAFRQVSARDYWIFMYFVMGTCRRIRGDQCVQIGLVGDTSIGKSTLFEAPLTDTAHYYVSDAGIGRFKVDNKTVLFFHDIDINDICFGKDRDLIKTVARSEPTVSKIHSATASIPPVHLFYTSNTNLFNHKVSPTLLPPKGIKREWSTTLAVPSTSSTYSDIGEFDTLHHLQNQNSQLSPWNSYSHVSDLIVTSKNKRHVQAVRSRFLECFCPSIPFLDMNLFPRGGNFQRQHMILGIYQHVLNLLENSYSPSDFASPVLPLYLLSGLAKHARGYETLLSISSISVSDKIIQLAEKYFPSSSAAHQQQYMSIINLIKNV